MQTPVRFYITQNDDQTIVRTVPVAKRITDPQTTVAEVTETHQAESTARKNVAARVRSVVKRESPAS